VTIWRIVMPAPPHRQAARGLLEAVGTLPLMNARQGDFAPFEFVRRGMPRQTQKAHDHLKARHTLILDTPKAAAISAGPLPSSRILRTASTGTDGFRPL
jgi:hypothetical protein